MNLFPKSLQYLDLPDNKYKYIKESLAKLFVIPECFYPRYRHSGTDMVFQAVRTRSPLKSAAGMTELGLLQEPQRA